MQQVAWCILRLPGSSITVFVLFIYHLMKKNMNNNTKNLQESKVTSLNCLFCLTNSPKPTEIKSTMA